MHAKLPRFIRERKILSAVGGIIVAGGVVFGAIAAYASIPDSSGIIHACYQSPPPAHGANLQVIDTSAGGSCGGGMAALSWNQTGPQGPTGATGATGATGSQGPAGPSTAGPGGLGVVVVRAQTTAGFGPLTAVCPSATPFVIGGGTSTDSGNFATGDSLPWDLTTNSPISTAGGGSLGQTGPPFPEGITDQYGWKATFVNTGNSGSIVVYAICSA
jgi:hypothetical protein